ncbi:MAG: proteobacterial dedicated sortase system histidine kinase [Alteromonadaceae bacterium]|nr:MAG: proteobacterial dedicated sortase system histidine kinase [Alteromonadaceae bacterium]
MKLRKQLLFLSLVTLSLPWVGCQYLREMDAALRHGQTEAMAATARAVAARVRSDSTLASKVQAMDTRAHRQFIYAHDLDQAPIVDGYHDDWVSQGYPWQPWQTQLSAPYKSSHKASHDSSHEIAQTTQAKPDAALMAGTQGDQLYLVFRASQGRIRYFNPSSNDLNQGLKNGLNKGLNNVDHLRLKLGKQPGRYYALYVEAPGTINVLRIDQTQNKHQPDYQIKGQWVEWKYGYQIEFQLPLHWTTNGLNIEVHSGNTNSQISSAQSPPTTPALTPPLISPSKIIEEELKIFSHKSLTLSVTNSSAFIVGKSELMAPEESTGNKRHGLVQWFYSIALKRQTLPRLTGKATQGNIPTSEVQEALQGGVGKSWYRQGKHSIARVAVPIYAARTSQNPTSAKQAEAPEQLDIIGAVVAEQSAHTLASLTDNAFTQLLLYSFLVSCGAAFFLVVYATWLSGRIRRLSKAARNAISDSGKITENFPTSTTDDEIGELSRSYAQLLARLREYTHYLRTLSNKLSHELRTPLAIVKSSLDNLEQIKLSTQASVYANRAREGANRLSNILNAMSAASRVEQAIASAEVELIPCDQLLTDLRAAYDDVYKHVKIGINIQAHRLGFKLEASGELLVQMLDKLVDNAADFCPDQGFIELGLYRSEQTIVITVRNQGPPLPKHMQGQLFDSMVSVRNPQESREKSHHLGLGLYIVRLITDFHRGEVNGYNVPDNSGVIFEVRLPID